MRRFRKSREDRSYDHFCAVAFSPPKRSEMNTSSLVSSYQRCCDCPELSYREGRSVTETFYPSEKGSYLRTVPFNSRKVYWRCHMDRKERELSVSVGFWGGRVLPD